MAETENAKREAKDIEHLELDDRINEMKKKLSFKYSFRQRFRYSSLSVILYAIT